jgi:hypothetical protein
MEQDMSMATLETRIRERAYAIWEHEGRPEGREREHWERAAREILASGTAEIVAGAAKRQTKSSSRGRSRRAA